MSEREELEQLEAALALPEAADAEPFLVLLAGREVSVPGEERRAALRRAMLLLAAGGDPRRELEPEGRAATSLADELATPERQAELLAALEELAANAGGLVRVRQAATELLEAPERAWRLFACVLLAEELERD